eukprot:6711080-Heterocapsa_arctica.AAC.1
MTCIVNFVAKGADGTPQPMPKNMSLTRSKAFYEEHKGGHRLQPRPNHVPTTPKSCKAWGFRCAVPRPSFSSRGGS